MNIYSLPIPVANANGVKAFSEYGISKILETLTLGKNRMDGWMNHENFYHLNLLILNILTQKKVLRETNFNNLRNINPRKKPSVCKDVVSRKF